MTLREIINGGAALLALFLASLVMGWNQTTTISAALESNKTANLRYTTMPDGRRALFDASNHAIPFGNYQRIIAGSIAARSALGELCEKNRLVGVISAGLSDAPDSHRFYGIPVLDTMKETEEVLTLEPDLVIVNALSSISHVQRLRDAGILVFTLGDMRGVDSFLRDIVQVGVLIGQPERGERLAKGYRRRIRAVASDVAMHDRKQGIYLSAYGTQMFGGTVGTSYHDILRFGGLVDAAKGKFVGWPQYTNEHILSLDPEIIVSPNGVPKTICEGSVLSSLRACANHRAGFVELPASWLEDPSLIMLDVAESIREAVYGPR